MRGFKTASGVIAIIEGIGAIIMGGLLIAGGALMDSIGAEFLSAFTDIFEKYLGGALSMLGSFSGIVIGVGVYFAVIGLLYFIFGIKACKSNSGKGTAITLLIFSIFMFNPLVFVFCIVYLATRGSQNQNYGGGGQSYDSGNDYSSDNRYV